MQVLSWTTKEERWLKNIHKNMIWILQIINWKLFILQIRNGEDQFYNDFKLVTRRIITDFRIHAFNNKVLKIMIRTYFFCKNFSTSTLTECVVYSSFSVLLLRRALARNITLQNFAFYFDWLHKYEKENNIYLLVIIKD